ncbi:pyridine nucleotide-disulfide oxidoreductase-domain-containing protein [Podospora appendiculata]|uniref:Pyridine nucleotide-disulfide oxidoreductase-domain-containing protein n=1 Tax=Podospora appendiculata TaxID=314037 RepID=A0AAE0XIM0_9PEZI|nr:pyridine nucleotide-disulfide oxidoreductase-domain-containing protein [Podospora appendiculata]
MYSLRQKSYSLGRDCLRTKASSARQWTSYSAAYYVTVGRLFARQHHVAAIVVGSGPAGIATVGSLIEQLGEGKVAWIDPAFRGGRINRFYREVPSNTQVGLFLAYADAVKPFQEICEAASKPNAITALQELPQNHTCSLHQAGDMLRLLSDGLAKHDRVESCVGRVGSAKWDAATSTWTLSVRDYANKEDIVRSAPLVVYCTGSSPTTVALPTPFSNSLRLLSLDMALKPSAIARHLPSDRPLRIGVMGSSHSAILVLMNLVRLAQTSHPKIRVRWFARSPELKYAEYRDGWILYDNTGLKGDAARFARQQLEGDALASSPAGKVITRVDCSGGAEKEQKALAAELPECEYVVQAVGFSPDPLPSMESVEVVFDHATGGFTDAATGEPVPGLFGAGIAFPERTVDPLGNVEYAVGFMKFMRFIKKVVPAWVAQTGAK